MRHPFLPPSNRADSPDSPSGFTLIESLVAIIIVSLTVVSVLPPIFWATATRVQNRRAEQAVQLAQSEIERVRTVVERGSYTALDLPPVVAGAGANNLKSTPTLVPASYSGIRRSTVGDCRSLDDAKQPAAVAQYIEIDTDPKNDNCKADFMVQVFRSEGTVPEGSAVGSPPSAFTMGVRVYAEPALLALRRGDVLDPKGTAAKLRGSSGLGQQSTRPMAVLYGTVVRSRAGNSLGVYKKLCDKKDC
jgi:prepilin-type N-terminal cleavage/methylation domain-containing protein